ncbi:MAG TPA: hypothetical protein VFR86_11195, partial [Burkholderiaceae bacterium]|nr:hypothetical protein [Burkholderiaceae bacterium]
MSATSPLPAIPQSGAAPLEQAQYVRDVAAFSRRLNAGDVTASLSDLVTAHRALATIAHGVTDPERIEALLGIAQHHYVAGYALAGIEPAIDAMNAARAHGDPLWLMRALNTLGYCLSDTVDVAGATEYFVEALELAIAHQSERAECSLWGGLGTALVYAGQHDEAFACFERAASKTGAPLTVRAAAYTNLALLCLYKSDLENGLEYARQAIAAMPDPHAPNEMLNRVLAETYCARLLLADKPTQAAQRVAIAKELAAKSRSERAWHAASIAEGLCEVARGHVDVGLSRLNRLLEQARSMRTGLRDTLLALVSAFQSIGQPDRADQYVRELAHFSRSNRRDYFRSRLAALRIRAAATQSDPTPQAEAEPPGSA